MEKINLNNKTIILSRTDSIGDVILTLPLAGFLKKTFSNVKIVFLCNKYTEAIVSTCSAIDTFVDKNTIDNFEKLHADAIIHIFPDKKIAKAAKKAKIPIRIGTSHRFFHLTTCNRRINFSRIKSELHESQLNFKLLKGLGINVLPTLAEMYDYANFNKINNFPKNLSSIIDRNEKNIIIHPGSKGSAREWGLENFAELRDLLLKENFHLFLTGTEAEGTNFRKNLMLNNNKITDLSGKLSLSELIGFISICDALVAVSTGPLHIAGVCGIHAIGIFPPIHPMHPGRWAPIGPKTKIFVVDENCSLCRKNGNCSCMKKIKAKNIAEYLTENIKK